MLEYTPMKGLNLNECSYLFVFENFLIKPSKSKSNFVALSKNRLNWMNWSSNFFLARAVQFLSRADLVLYENEVPGFQRKLAADLTSL